MASMMKNSLCIDAPQPASSTDENWSVLYARIRTLAASKAAAMATQEACDDEEFDRGARALRTLMSAADIARRLKDRDAEEKDLNARNASPAVSDARIRDLKARLEDQIDRLEREECEREAGAAPKSGDAS